MVGSNTRRRVVTQNQNLDDLEPNRPNSDLGSPTPSKSDRIYFDRRSLWAQKAMLLDGHKETLQPDEAAILWLLAGYGPKLKQLSPYQLINHFPNELAVTNKCCLTENLARYDRSRDDNSLPMSAFYPESYRLSDPTERKTFLAQLPENETPDNLWVYKPGNRSSGKGIEIIWNFDALRKKCAAWGDRPIVNKNEQAIMQRHINNPLLLDGRKSEIRVYWLVASLDPLMVLVYPEATVRLNTLPYKLDDFRNPLIHVTNVYQQNNHPQYDPNIELKWTFEDLGNYLSNNFEIAGSDFLQAQLMPRVRRILRTVSLASCEKLQLNYPHQGDCFAVFGADLIIDENLNPWLSEVQEAPGLNFDDAVKRDVIPPMLGEAARIVLDVRNRRFSNRAFRDLQSVRNYQWVVNDLEPELVEIPEQGHGSKMDRDRLSHERPPAKTA